MIRLTDRQQAVVDHRGELIVAASAGSGKTEVLARRCVALLLDDKAPASLDRMLIVTFTRAAAAELRVRIGRMIRTALCDCPPTMKRHLRRQETLLDAAEIGTIDSWCGRIVREHFETAGVDPNFTMLDEQGAALLRAQTLDQLFEQVASSDETVFADVRRWLKRQPKPTEHFFRDFIAGLQSYRDHLADPAMWLAEIRAQVEMPVHARTTNVEAVLAKTFANEIADFLSYVTEIAAGEAELLDPIVPLQSYSEDPNNQSIEDGIAVLNEVRFPTPSKASSKSIEKRAAQCKKECDKIKKAWAFDEIERLLANLPDVDELLGVCLSLEARYHELLQNAKRKRGVLEFGDVVRAALALLQTSSTDEAPQPSPLAMRLRDHYQHIFVDEFQDTNRIQAQLFELISRADTPGNLFTVGDIKQSIYGFRRADPRLFAARLAALESDDRENALFLPENFRSHPAILNTLNLLFARLFSKDFGGSDYGENEKFESGNPVVTDENGPKRVKLTIVHKDARKKTHDDEVAEANDETAEDDLEQMEIEALAIAKEIQSLIARGATITTKTADNSTARPIGFGDIAVLLRSARVNSYHVAWQLRLAGIPALTGGRESLFSTHEVNDVVNVLRLLVSEDRDVTLAAYLRGPLVGLSAAELLQIRAAAPDDSYINATRAFLVADSNGELRQKVAIAMAALERWRRLARLATVIALVNRIIRESGIDLIARGAPLGQYRVAALHALRDVAASHGDATLGDFVAALDHMEELEQSPEVPAVDAEDAVRIMTVHASKGLEFPVVFLANTGAKWNVLSGSKSSLFDDDIGAGVRFFDTEKLSELRSPEHKQIQRAIRDREREEELRLLYVAATRAQEYLYFVGHGNSAKLDDYCALPQSSGPLALWRRRRAASVLDWLMMAGASCAGHDDVDFTIEVAMPADLQEWRAKHEREQDKSDREKPALTEDDRAWAAATVAAIRSVAAIPRESTPIVLSVSQVKGRAQRQRATDRATLNDGNASSSVALPTFVTPGRKSPTAVGLATHRFFEHVQWVDFVARDGVAKEMQRLRGEKLLRTDELELIDERGLRWFAETETARIFAENEPQMRRELPFVYGKAANDNERILLRGVIDLLVRDADGLQIYDFKTDRVASDAARARLVADYSVQMRLYAEAAAQIAGTAVTSASLIFLQARTIVSIAPTPIPTEEFRDLVSPHGDE